MQRRPTVHFRSLRLMSEASRSAVLGPRCWGGSFTVKSDGSDPLTNRTCLTSMPAFSRLDTISLWNTGTRRPGRQHDPGSIFTVTVPSDGLMECCMSSRACGAEKQQPCSCEIGTGLRESLGGGGGQCCGVAGVSAIRDGATEWG